MTEPLRNVKTVIEAVAADGRTYRLEAEGWSTVEGVRARVGAFLSEIEMDQATPAPKAPKWADLFGIDPDYCGGRDVSEWLDEQRGEA